MISSCTWSSASFAAAKIEQQRAYDNLLRDAVVGQPADVRNLRERVVNGISMPGMQALLVRRAAYLFAVAAILLLALSSTVIYWALQSKPVAIVYADAVDDHYDDVVRRVPLEGWRETPVDINRLEQKQLGENDLIEKLGPSGYQMKRARVCDLAGEAYVHVEYMNDKGQEISLFMKRRGESLPGAPKEVVSGCPIHIESTRGFEVAGFQSARFTVLIVSNLARAENLRLARESAARLSEETAGAQLSFLFNLRTIIFVSVPLL